MISNVSRYLDTEEHIKLADSIKSVHANLRQRLRDGEQFSQVLVFAIFFSWLLKMFLILILLCNYLDDAAFFLAYLSLLKSDRMSTSLGVCLSVCTQGSLTAEPILYFLTHYQ